MDTFRFEIGKRDDPANGIVDAVNVFVNDRDLMDILREVELPFAAREGKPDLAGRYVSLRPENVFLPSPRLFGEPSCWPFVFDRAQYISASSYKPSDS